MWTGTDWLGLLQYISRSRWGRCQDVSEDLDDDDDTIPDLTDNCPFSVAGWFSTGASDYDRDGCHDLTNDPDDDNDGALTSTMIVQRV